MANYKLEDIVDLLGPTKDWPGDFLARYKKKQYDHTDRFCLCIFNFINGFNNRRFLEYCLANKKLEDKAAYRHIIDLTEILEQREQNLEKWFSFCIQEKRWTYLNGRTKFYNHNTL